MSLASSKRWLGGVLLISIGLRFIGLNQIDGPVFDEVFYPQYGLLYLQGEEFYYAHPPLANYMYAFSIWIYSLLPWINIESYQNKAKVLQKCSKGYQTQAVAYIHSLLPTFPLSSCYFYHAFAFPLSASSLPASSIMLSPFLSLLALFLLVLSCFHLSSLC